MLEVKFRSTLSQALARLASEHAVSFEVTIDDARLRNKHVKANNARKVADEH